MGLLAKMNLKIGTDMAAVKADVDRVLAFTSTDNAMKVRAAVAASASAQYSLACAHSNVALGQCSL